MPSLSLATGSALVAELLFRVEIFRVAGMSEFKLIEVLMELRVEDNSAFDSEAEDKDLDADDDAEAREVYGGSDTAAVRAKTAFGGNLSEHEKRAKRPSMAPTTRASKTTEGRLGIAKTKGGRMVMLLLL